jgi:predicted nuclease of predicted toxin-antitoxin system
MPISPMVARWLTNQGHDAVHAIDLNLNRAPDTVILAHAAQDARTVVTADLDYPRLLALSQATAPSLILFRHGNWNEAEVIARLTDVLAVLTETEITQSILVVDKDRIRRRRLPLA